MTARERWGVLGSSPVPWLASVAAVVVVVALSWLATDEPALVGSAATDVGQVPADTEEDDPERPFSGVPALQAIMLEAPPGGPYELIPDGQEGTGHRTEASLVASAVAAGESGNEVRSDLLASGFRGGFGRGWVNQSDGSAVLILIDEFAKQDSARRWTSGLARGMEQAGGREAPTSLADAVARRFEADTPDGVQQQVAIVFPRGRRVVLVKVATLGTLDVAAAESYARAQAERMADAAP